jgi:protein-S-isoprenylcysteine O-methyltransferase Ste14
MIRQVPLIWFVAVAAVGFGWRSWLQYRRFGHSGIVLFRTGRWAQNLRESLIPVLGVVIGGQAVVYAFDPARLAPLALVTPPSGGVSGTVGALFLLGGIALMVAAQLDLGASWRVGMDESSRPGLVTTGLYRFSRNPIYLSLFVSLIGLIVLLPTWLTIGVALASVAGIHNQVREEERFLYRTYGDEFVAYARRVGRFVPGLGTIRA